MTHEILSTTAILISVVSVYFAMYSWKQSYRPIIIARISTHTGGNVATALNIVVENSGNRPAKDIQLCVNESDLKNALSIKFQNNIPLDVSRCFVNQAVIPILANGKSITNAFGLLSTTETSTWKVGAILPIKIKYSGLDNGVYCNEMNLVLHADEGFAQVFWE